MSERMGDRARDHECANERVPANEKGKGKKKKRDTSVSRLSPMFSSAS